MNTKALAALGLLGAGALTLYAYRDALGMSRRSSRRPATRLHRGAEPMIPLVVTGQLSGLSGRRVTLLLHTLIGDNPKALQRLVAGEVPHSYPVTVEEAQALGLAVEVAAPDDNIRALIQALAPKGRLTWPFVQQ